MAAVLPGVACIPGRGDHWRVHPGGRERHVDSVPLDGIGDGLNGQSRLGQSQGIDINVGHRQHAVRKREPPPRREHPASRGHEHAAVVDRTSRLVADEVGVDVAGGERPRTVLHESTADLVLVERKVAGRWVEDQVDAPGRQRRPRPVSHPGVLADLEADADPATVKPQVADRHVAATDRHRAPATANPRSEPPGLVVDAVAGEILLAGDTRDHPVDDEGRRVKEAALEANRQPHRHGDPAGGRHDLAEHFQRQPLHPG